MEFLNLKRTKSLTFLFLFLIYFLFSTACIYSQNNVKSDVIGPKTLQDDLINAFKKSYNYESKGLYNKAIDVMMEYYNKDNYEINLRLGWLYYNSKKYSESMGYYMNAINIMPYAIEPRFGYVLPAAAVEDWSKVVEQYNMILSIDPQNTVANFRMGMIYYYKPDYNAAYKYLEKVVNLYPFDYDSILMFAWTNYQLGKANEARVLFQKCLMIKPDDQSATDGLNLLK